MAIAYFLKLEGVKGESSASKHPDEIEVSSWSLGAHNPTSVHGSGLSAGKVKFTDITFTKRVDKSSAKLLELCCTGKHITTALLSCAKSTGDKNPADYLTVKFEEVHISGVQGGGSEGDEVGTETISFAFGKITFDYKIQGKDGTLTGAGTTTWDITKSESS
jgi:type VI secretion system secreted protein Hcp